MSTTTTTTTKPRPVAPVSPSPLGAPNGQEDGDALAARVRADVIAVDRADGANVAASSSVTASVLALIQYVAANVPAGYDAATFVGDRVRAAILADDAPRIGKGRAYDSLTDYRAAHPGARMALETSSRALTTAYGRPQRVAADGAVTPATPGKGLSAIATVAGYNAAERAKRDAAKEARARRESEQDESALDAARAFIGTLPVSDWDATARVFALSRNAGVDVSALAALAVAGEGAQ